MIQTSISRTEYIEWASKEDCLLFWATISSFKDWNNLHAHITGQLAEIKEYERLRSGECLIRLAEIIRTQTVKRRGRRGSIPLAIAMKSALERGAK